MAIIKVKGRVTSAHVIYSLASLQVKSPFQREMWRAVLNYKGHASMLENLTSHILVAYCYYGVTQILYRAKLTPSH